ncbi:hypothetical protein ACFQAS_08550 [Halopenitus salinus]|uniref:Uncharacterized protein n=1 Tax=Halopenitus salinus TaxID=1198295 RepID=A0ABD5UNU0_9EURY
MPDPARLRDSTQIVVPCRVLDEIRDRLEAEYTVTVFEADGRCRIIGSPIEIKAVSDFLTRHGITVA